MARRLPQIVVKGRLGLDRAADYLEELRAHSRSRAVSVALLSPSPDTDPDDLDHLERVRAYDATARGHGCVVQVMPVVNSRMCILHCGSHSTLLSQQGVRTISQDTIHVAAGSLDMVHVAMYHHMLCPVGHVVSASLGLYISAESCICS